MNNFLKYFFYIIGYMGVWALVMLLVLNYMEHNYGENSKELVLALVGFLFAILLSWDPVYGMGCKTYFRIPW